MQIALKSIVSISHTEPYNINYHSHIYHEIVYCVKGECAAELPSHRETIREGSFYATQAGTVHNESCSDSCCIIYFYFTAPAKLVREGVFVDKSGSILTAIRCMQQEYQQDLPHKELMLPSLLTQILVEIQRCTLIPVQSRIFDVILQYVDENMEHEIDFKALADRHGYSYDRFRHLFKGYTGHSPQQYVNNARIRKAKFLLEQNSHISLTRLAYSCGFSSSSQFANIFRAKTGLSPSEYKKRSRRSITRSDMPDTER